MVDSSNPAPYSSITGGHREHKPLGIIPSQQRRREDALKRQKTARRDLQLHARKLIHQWATHDVSYDACGVSNQSEDSNFFENRSNSMNEIAYSNEGEVEAVTSYAFDRLSLDEGKKNAKPEGKEGIRSIHEWKEQQLMIPEWMIDIPPDLSNDWYVLARPEGRRCLVISANGFTVSRLKNGKLLHKFSSSLPNGSRNRSASSGSHVYCILDCVFQEENQTYYVLDLMAWNGISLYDCTTEFRFFWIVSKLAEAEVWNEPSDFQKFRFCPLKFYDCDKNGLTKAYFDHYDFRQDGILFYNKQAHYSLGVSPLVLLWKDDRCSKYVIDTDKNGNIPTRQQVVLEYQENGNLVTADLPPLSLAIVDSSFSNVGKGLKPGALVRISLGMNAIDFVDEKPQLINFRFEEIANQRRASADSFSKILFQYNARFSPLKFESILSTVQTMNHGLNDNDRKKDEANDRLSNKERLDIDMAA